MRVEYDAESDAAYIYLLRKTAERGVVKTVPSGVLDLAGTINLDFDDGGRLVGIEVFYASRLLPHELLESALEDPQD